MKAGPESRTDRLKQYRLIVVSAGLLALSGLAAAQEKLSLEDLEKLIAEQRTALEEAIADREATAANADVLRKNLEQARKRSLQVEEELTALCNEQEALIEGSFDECMATVNN